MSEKFGKYKGIVTNTEDDEGRGRIKVECPSIYGDSESPWCLPCVPLAIQQGGVIVLPQVGDMVWVEFEEGDTDSPIWVGGLWTDGSIAEFTDEKIHLVGKTGSKVEIDHNTGDILIEGTGEVVIKGSKVAIQP